MNFPILGLALIVQLLNFGFCSTSFAMENQPEENVRETELFKAIRNNDEPALRTLLKQGVSPNAHFIDRTNELIPALAEALRVAKPTIVQLLIDSGADAKATVHNITLLMYLVEQRRLPEADMLEKAKILIAGGADINAKLRNATVLNYAIGSYLSVLHYLMEQINPSLIKDYTPWTTSEDRVNEFMFAKWQQDILHRELVKNVLVEEAKARNISYEEYVIINAVVAIIKNNAFTFKYVIWLPKFDFPLFVQVFNAHFHRTDTFPSIVSLTQPIEDQLNEFNGGEHPEKLIAALKNDAQQMQEALMIRFGAKK